MIHLLGCNKTSPFLNRNVLSCFLNDVNDMCGSLRPSGQNVQSIPSNRSTITETSVRTNCFAWNVRNDEKSR